MKRHSRLRANTREKRAAAVIPAAAGIQGFLNALDSRLRGNDSFDGAY